MDERMVERLAKALYEADPESAYNDSAYPVEWKYNFAHQQRYKELARAAALWFISASAS